MAEPFTITAANFEAEVLKSTTPVLVDFWAPWCGPCRIVAPSVEEMATQYAGKLKVGKLNVDEHPAVAQRYNITGIRRCSSLRVAQWSIPWSAQCQRAPCKKSGRGPRQRVTADVSGTSVQHDQPVSVRVHRHRSWNRSSGEPCQTSISVGYRYTPCSILELA